MKETILVTGGAGFIASNLIRVLLATSNYKVISIDNFDLFYARQIKESNLEAFINHSDFTFYEGDILDGSLLESLNHNIDAIVHLAAKAGVRPSIEDPIGYQRVNEVGTLKLLEFAKRRKIKRFVFASSSSVYGVNKNVPWNESDKLLTPISPYAATKLSGEMMGHVYSHLFDINFIALRFFTVYGPGQRPDLAIHKFFKLIQDDKPIDVYGDGSTFRDYTYVGDIVAGILKAVNYSSSNKFEIINLGNHATVSLKELISSIEAVMNKKATINYLPEQPGDVPKTYADIDKAKEILKYDPKTDIKEGLSSFYQWFLKFYKI